MARGLKREPLITINENRAVDSQEFRSAKREKVRRNHNPFPADPESEPEPVPAPEKPPRSARNVAGDVPVQGPAERRVLRSQYLAVKNIIHEQKEELCRGDSERLQCLIKEVDCLYEHVQRPREQVADAEALLEISNTLITAVKSYSNDGFTPTDFVSRLIHEFGNADRRRMENDRVLINWKDIGVLVAPIFRKAHGCCTMIGPMNTELKQRKVAAQRKRGTATGFAARPEQLNDTGGEEKTDTDKNMATMFDILRRKKSVRLEHLILNRFSFAQTVENLFAMSFLVKDGRAQIAVDDKGIHLASPRNAPLSDLVASGEVVYNHFVFRFDFKDWKLMIDTVAEGEELMPHRYQVSIPLSQADQVPDVTVAIPTKNRGQVLNDESATELC